MPRSGFWGVQGTSVKTTLLEATLSCDRLTLSGSFIGMTLHGNLVLDSVALV